MQDNSPDGINLWLVNLRLKVIFVTVHSFIFSHSSVRESVHDTALCLSASWWGLMRCDLRDWQNKNLLGRFKRTFPSELCVSPGRLKIVQIFLLLSSFSAHPRFWWLKRGKKFEEIVINLWWKTGVTWEKIRRVVHYFPSAFKTSILRYFGVLFQFKTYLLSRIYPSTLCSSLPKRPHGLKFRQHLSPVLGGKKKEKSCVSSSHSLLAESRRTSSSALSIFPPCCSNFLKVFATTVRGLFY